ncbi:hypothetical protein GTW08_26585, partial [Pseudonocardia sp. SID8383]|nr:hypothetical protein [Pseudonocardia sp. SID8383]
MTRQRVGEMSASPVGVAEVVGDSGAPVESTVVAAGTAVRRDEAGTGVAANRATAAAPGP